jgi:hypothetical protein
MALFRGLLVVSVGARADLGSPRARRKLAARDQDSPDEMD